MFLLLVIEINGIRKKVLDISKIWNYEDMDYYEFVIHLWFCHFIIQEMMLFTAK